MSRDMVIIVLALSNPACVFLGFLFGRLTSATLEIEKHMTEEHQQEPMKFRRRRPTALTVIAFSVALIGIMTVAVGVSVTRNQDKIVGCVIGYSNATADALEQRTEASAAANRAMDDVMAAIGLAFTDAPGVGRERVRAAIEDYNTARDQAKEAIREHPLPEAPRDACSELLD